MTVAAFKSPSEILGASAAEIMGGVIRPFLTPGVRTWAIAGNKMNGANKR